MKFSLKNKEIKIPVSLPQHTTHSLSLSSHTACHELSLPLAGGSKTAVEIIFVHPVMQITDPNGLVLGAGSQVVRLRHLLLLVLVVGHVGLRRRVMLRRHRGAALPSSSPGIASASTAAAWPLAEAAASAAPSLSNQSSLIIISFSNTENTKK